MNKNIIIPISAEQPIVLSDSVLSSNVQRPH